MNSAYSVSAAAQNDLDEIWAYIAADNRNAADRLLGEIQQRFAMLARQPEIGEPRSEIRPDLRSFPVGNYVVFYKLVDARVVVVRVLHGARDVGSIF